MADEELTYDQEQGALRLEAERALLKTIKASAESGVKPESVKQLAEAYALVIANKALSETKGGFKVSSL